MKNSSLKSPRNGQFRVKDSRREPEIVKDCLIDLTQRSMVKRKKDSAQEQRSRVTARVVPAEELLQLFSDAFSSKKAKESDHIKYNDQIPY